MQTVGQILRAEREKQGISVKDVEKGTSIRALYIQAIEDDNYKVLPGEVYLKGFVRNYASFLGLDPQAMMDVYKKSQEPQPAPASTAPSQPERPREREQRSTAESRSGSSGGRWLIALIIIVLVAGGAWAAMSFLNQAPEQPKPAPLAQQPVKPAPAPVPTPGTTAKQPAATPAATPIVVTAKYTDSCWTRVTADGQDIYTGIPKVGETLTWNAKQSMVIRLGNAAGVDMTYNGQPQGRLGDDGDVIVKTFGTAATSISSPGTGAAPGTSTPPGGSTTQR